MNLDDERNLLALARGVAGNYLKANPGQWRHAEELVGDACQGVAEAVARHDPAKGASLVSYAYRRATGAVIDGVRKRSPLTRGAYAKEGGVEAARQLNPISLEELAENGWAGPSADPGETEYDDCEHVLQLLRLCTPSERYVLVACVMYGHTLTEVAAHLDVTLSAAHQFKTRGLQRMRTEKPARRSPRKAAAA